MTAVITTRGKCDGRQPASTAFTATFSAVIARWRTGSIPTRWSGGSSAQSRQACTRSGSRRHDGQTVGPAPAVDSTPEPAGPSSTDVPARGQLPESPDRSIEVSLTNQSVGLDVRGAPSGWRRPSGAPYPRPDVGRTHRGLAARPTVAGALRRGPWHHHPAGSWSVVRIDTDEGHWVGRVLGAARPLLQRRIRHRRLPSARGSARASLFTGQTPRRRPSGTPRWTGSPSRSTGSRWPRRRWRWPCSTSTAGPRSTSLGRARLGATRRSVAAGAAIGLGSRRIGSSNGQRSWPLQVSAE